MPATRAEEYYGLRFAGQALALDPAYEPAQMVLLSLALEKAMEQAGSAQPLAVTNPSVHELLATVNPDGTYQAYVRAGSYRVEFAVQDPHEFIDSPDSDLFHHWNETGGWNNVGHTGWFTVQTGDEVVLDAGVD